VVVIRHHHLHAIILVLDDLPHLVVKVVRALDVLPLVMMRLAGLGRARCPRLALGVVLLRVVALRAAAATAKLLVAQLAIGEVRIVWLVGKT